MTGLGLVCKFLSMRKCDRDANKAIERIDVDKPLWNQGTYYGRWRHFAFITDIRTIFVSEEKLWRSKELCELYKEGKEPEGVKISDVIWAKKLRDSSFHPDTGKPMNVIGRMSFQLPGNIFLTAGMLTYYKTARSMVAWQFLNQAFNAIVNYTNRNAALDSPADNINEIKLSFVAATAASCTVAICFKRFLTLRGSAVTDSKQRWGPFFAVVAGNTVNLPIMRKREIERGIPLFITDDTSKEETIISKVAAIKAISECLFSRIVMAAPGMLLVPEIMKRIKSLHAHKAWSWIGPPTEAFIVKILLVVSHTIEFLYCVLNILFGESLIRSLLFMIPSALAIYPQKHSMNSNLLRLYPKEYDEYRKIFKDEKPRKLYYNKGL